MSVYCGRSFAVVVAVAVVEGGGLSDCVGVAAAAAAVHGALYVSHEYALHVQLRSSSLHKTQYNQKLWFFLSFFFLS